MPPTKRKAEDEPAGEPAGKAKKDDGPVIALRNGAARKKPRTYKRWNKSGVGRITKFAEVPKGWDWNDYDIDENDIEGNIKRCKERIEDDIMPQWWEEKLKEYKNDKAELQKIIDSEPAGLDKNVIMRLKTLEVIKKSLSEEENGDEYCQMKNVTELLKKYRAKELQWKPGYVTYWANGKQLSDFEKFEWKRFQDISDEHFDWSHDEEDLRENWERGHIVWVEGGEEGPGPGNALVNWPATGWYRNAPFPPPGREHMLDMSIRVPGATNGRMSDFLDDTGATRTQIYKDDVRRIIQLANRKPRFIRHMAFRIANGQQMVNTIMEVEICINDESNPPNELTPWTSLGISCVARDGGGRHQRLGGQYPRSAVFTATAPDGAADMYLARDRPSLRNCIPIGDVMTAVGIPADPPAGPGVLPDREWRSLVRTSNAIP